MLTSRGHGNSAAALMEDRDHCYGVTQFRCYGKWGKVWRTKRQFYALSAPDFLRGEKTVMDTRYLTCKICFGVADSCATPLPFNFAHAYINAHGDARMHMYISPFLAHRILPSPSALLIIFIQHSYSRNQQHRRYSPKKRFKFLRETIQAKQNSS